jgi:hypothetical protein
MAWSDGPENPVRCASKSPSSVSRASREAWRLSLRAAAGLRDGRARRPRSVLHYPRPAAHAARAEHRRGDPGSTAADGDYAGTHAEAFSRGIGDTTIAFHYFQVTCRLWAGSHEEAFSILLHMVMT